MKPLPYGVSPDKADASRETQTTFPSARDAAAWQREMERAQTQDWFQGAAHYEGRNLAEQEGALRSTRMEASGCRPQMSSVLATSRQLAMQALRLDLAAGAGSVEVQTQGQKGPSSAGGETHFAQAVKQTVPTAQVAAVAAIRSPAQGRLPPGGIPESPHAAAEGTVPLRLHLEIGDQGGCLWIGAAQADPEQIAQAVAYVRQRLAARGIALVDVVCNGKSWNGNLTTRAELAQRVNYPIEGEHNGNGR